MITPFGVIGLILSLISIVALAYAVFNELVGRGGKGTITVIIISLLVFALSAIVIYFEQGFITEENKLKVIISEVVIISAVLLRLYFLGYS